MEPAELSQKAAAAAERFRAMVREVDRVELDYDAASIEKLSALVSAKREAWKRDMDEQMLFRFTELMGCYYGECIRRLFSGSWGFVGQDAVVRVDGQRKKSFFQKLAGGSTSEVHLALPFNNVQSHFARGDEKSLSMLFTAFSATVNGEVRAS